MDLSKLQSKKILIVEDDEINCELIKEILSDYDVCIESVISGEEAVLRLFQIVSQWFQIGFKLVSDGFKIKALNNIKQL